MPSRFRDVCRQKKIKQFFLTRGLDKCIFMFTEEEWGTVEQKFKNLSFTKQESRHFNRMFFSGAVEAIPDGQGRFLIPQYLKEYAQIKMDTVIIGISNRIEIWNLKSWQEFYKNSRDSFEKVAENILNL